MSVVQLRADLRTALIGCPHTGLSCTDSHEAGEYADAVLAVIRTHLPTLLRETERLRRVQAAVAALEELGDEMTGGEALELLQAALA